MKARKPPTTTPVAMAPSKKAKRVRSDAHERDGRADDVPADVGDDRSHVHEDRSDDEMHTELARSRKKRAAAVEYLARLRTETSSALTAGPGGADAANVASVDERVDERLRKDVLQATGRVFRAAAGDYKDVTPLLAARLHVQRKHTPTCVSFSGARLVAGYKGGCVVVFEPAGGCGDASDSGAAQTNGRGYSVRATLSGGDGDVLCVTASDDVVAAGYSTGAVCVWRLDDAASAADGTCAPEHVFRQHRGAVTGVALHTAHGAAVLYTCGADRTVRVWNVSVGVSKGAAAAEASSDDDESGSRDEGGEMTDVAQAGLVDTLFGHQDGVTAVAAMPSPDTERCVTVGGRDRSARVWKIADETQLVFRPAGETGAFAGLGELTAVAALDREHFVTGGDDGRVAFWGLARKRPLCHVAHPRSAPGAVTALAALPLSDVVCAAYADGSVALWAVDAESWREATLLVHVELPAGAAGVLPCANGVALSGDGRMLAVAAGRDQRDGRWSVRRGARNEVLVYALRPSA